MWMFRPLTLMLGPLPMLFSRHGRLLPTVLLLLLPPTLPLPPTLLPDRKAWYALRDEQGATSWVACPAASRPSQLNTVSPAATAGAVAVPLAPAVVLAATDGQVDCPAPAAFWVLMRCSSSPTVALHALYSAAADRPLL